MSSTAKICTVCGVDCAALPRTKDANGRYTCKACYEQLLASRRAKQSAGGGGSGGVASGGATGFAVGHVGDDGSEMDGDAYVLADDLLTLEAASQELEVPRCPNCSSTLAVGAQSCAYCGFDRRTNAQTASVQMTPAQMALAGIRMPSKCGACGYSFKGLTSPRCPECGWNVPLRPSHERWRAEDSKRTVKSAYQTPLLMFFIGLTAAFAIRAGLAQHDGVPVQGVLVVYAVGFAVSYVIGLVVLAIAAKIVGYAAPVGLTMIRLAGIYAVMDAINPLLMFIPILGWIVSIFIYVQLMMSLLELELQDAMILGVLTFAAKVFVVLVVLGLLFG